MTVINFNGALRTYILADTTVSTLIDTKFYSIPAPQNVIMPYCIFQCISVNPMDNIVTFDNVVVERWQIDCYGSTEDSVQSINKAIFDRLHMKLYLTMSGYFVHAINFENSYPIDEPKGAGTSDFYKKISMDFRIKRNYLAT